MSEKKSKKVIDRLLGLDLKQKMVYFKKVIKFLFMRIMQMIKILKNLGYAVVCRKYNYKYNKLKKLIFFSKGVIAN